MDSSVRIFALICACLSALLGKAGGQHAPLGEEGTEVSVETDNEASHAGLASRRVPLTEPDERGGGVFREKLPGELFSLQRVGLRIEGQFA